ncbi:MAG: LysM peptidoglycan-binding domain-containing protein [Verrucomicrobiota bacterium]
MGFGQLKIAVALFAVAIMVGSILGGIYFWEKVRKPEIELLEGLAAIKAEDVELPDAGKDIYVDAVALIREGKMDEGRAKLFSILKYHPESERVRDARRIIGEFNLDRLLSSDPMPGKTTHEVRSGESLNLIANRNDCTIGFIMRANNMTNTTIHPGEQIVVFPLKFTVIVNVSERTLTLTLNDQFFKEYPVDRVRLPVGVTAPFATTISDKVAYFEDRRVPLTDARVHFAEKWIQTKRVGFVVAAAGEEELTGGGAMAEGEEGLGENFYAGVFVSRPDLEELFSLLRVSTPVSVID